MYNENVKKCYQASKQTNAESPPILKLEIPFQWEDIYIISLYHTK